MSTTLFWLILTQDQFCICDLHWQGTWQRTTSMRILILNGREHYWRHPQASPCLMLMMMHSKKLMYSLNSLSFVQMFRYFPFLFILTLQLVINLHMFCHFSLQDTWVYFRDVDTAKNVQSEILDTFVWIRSLFFCFPFDNSFCFFDRLCLPLAL